MCGFPQPISLNRAIHFSPVYFTCPIYPSTSIVNLSNQFLNSVPSRCGQIPCWDNKYLTLLALLSCKLFVYLTLCVPTGGEGQKRSESADKRSLPRGVNPSCRGLWACAQRQSIHALGAFVATAPGRIGLRVSDLQWRVDSITPTFNEIHAHLHCWAGAGWMGCKGLNGKRGGSGEESKGSWGYWLFKRYIKGWNFKKTSPKFSSEFCHYVFSVFFF